MITRDIAKHLSVLHILQDLNGGGGGGPYKTIALVTRYKTLHVVYSQPSTTLHEHLTLQRNH